MPINDLSTAAQAQPSSLWRNRDYMLLWGGQVVSSLGAGVSEIALPLFALALTNSPAQVGFITAVGALPYLFFSLPAGALIDRWDRKRVMMICDTGRAFAALSIPLTSWLGHLTVAQLYITSIVSGTLFVFFNIAEIACLPRVVPEEQLSAATAQNQAIDGITVLIGPSLGAILYQSANRLLPFIVDGISYIVSVISLFFIRTTFQGERIDAPRKLHTEIVEGLTWLWHEPLLRFTAFLTGGINLVLSGSTIILIVRAKELRAPAVIIGAIFSIAAVGGIVGSLVGERIQKRLGFGQVIIGVSWLQALLWPLYAITPNITILSIITAGVFLLIPVYNVTQISYLLSMIPDELQGRVNSVFRLIAYGGLPLGQACAGVLIQTITVRPTIIVFSTCLVVMAMLATFNAHVRATCAR